MSSGMTNLTDTNTNTFIALTVALVSNIANDDKDRGGAELEGGEVTVAVCCWCFYQLLRGNMLWCCAVYPVLPCTALHYLALYYQLCTTRPELAVWTKKADTECRGVTENY